MLVPEADQCTVWVDRFPFHLVFTCRLSCAKNSPPLWGGFLALGGIVCSRQAILFYLCVRAGGWEPRRKEGLGQGLRSGGEIQLRFRRRMRKEPEGSLLAMIAS